MQNLIDRLKSSRNIFLKAEGDSIEKWKSLPHNKEGLSLFLKWNIAEINYDGKSYFCSSNEELVNRLLKRSNISKKVDSLTFMSLRNIVPTWDLISDELISFSMKKKWQIVNFVSIDASNIEILDSVINDVMKEKEWF